MIEHINKLFALVVILSLFTYFERADYNLPLFVFVALLWNHNHPPQKARVWYLMTFSLLVDFIWIVYWAATWSNLNDKETSLYHFTLIVSSIMFVIKIIIVVILFLREDDCHQALF